MSFRSSLVTAKKQAKHVAKGIDAGRKTLDAAGNPHKSQPVFLKKKNKY